VAIALLALASLAASSPGGVPVERQALILTRALAYDENLSRRAGDEITVAVLSAKGSTDPNADAATKAFRSLGAVKVQGLPVRAIQIPYTNASTLAATIDGEGIDALYLSAPFDGELAALLEITRRKKVISMGSKEEQVNKGAALGVFSVEGKPTIFVNLPSSKSEGAAFSSDLLRLAKVIR
jgi:hypothetical protein